MESIQEYEPEAVFGNKRNLIKYLAGRKTTDHVLVCSNNSLGYSAYYDSRKDKVVLEVKGDNEEKLASAEIAFFEWAAEFFKKK